MSAEARTRSDGRGGSADPGATLSLLAEGPLDGLTDATRRRLLQRTPEGQPGLSAAVASILDDVRARGDAALREMAERFDGVRLESLEVPQERWQEALTGLPIGVRRALERAARNIRRFHDAQRPKDVSVEVEPGVRVTRVWSPLRRVGVYAPGGRAAYPSSVLMGVVPAKSAGVDEVVVCSPPGPAALPPPEVLAACAIGGADRLFAVGGAGAIAALALGTEAVPAVDAIVGPGNRWVTEAKRQIAGRIVVDAPAGPSEVLVLADGSADPALVALELLAQAEHDPEAAAVLVTTSAGLADATRRELAGLLAHAPRRDIAATALASHGALLKATTLDEAIAFAEAYAPEHLSVMTADPGPTAMAVRTSGATFVGSAASVAFGDYLTGANHVLPTAGRARSFSGLSTHHFLRAWTVQEIDQEGAASLAEDVALLAAAEGLPAHGAAALARRSR